MAEKAELKLNLVYTVGPVLHVITVQWHQMHYNCIWKAGKDASNLCK